MNNEKSLVTVYVKNGDINKALKIFKKRTFESGHLLELRDRKEFTKPTTLKRREKQQAIHRQELATLLENISDGNTIKVPQNKIKKKK